MVHRGSEIEALGKKLREYNRSLDAPPSVMENIDTLSSERASAVVTGQQPGLFTGPLYTIYKAISAIAIAKRLAGSVGGRFLPVFWNHSEDHDLSEVDHVYLLRENRPVRLEYSVAQAAAGPTAIAEIDLEKEQIEGLIAEIDRITPDSEFKRSILDRIREQAAESPDLGEFFSRLMLWLFGKRGLVMIEPRHLRELMVPIFTRMIEEPEAAGRLVAQAGERLKQGGLKPPIDQPSWFCNFFLDRQRVAYRNGQFTVNGRAVSQQELLGLLQEEPQRFSADVVTRPIIQDWLFPTYAYVAGPHEAAYLDQLREVYRWFSLRIPQIVPRHSCTLVETRVRRIIDRYAPWIDDLEELRQPERLLKQIVRDTREIGPTFARHRREISGVLQEIREYAAKIDPQLHRPGEAAEAKIAKELEKLEDKVAKAQREREPLLQRQIHRAANNLFPLGQSQERILNIVEFLVRHGVVMLEGVAERLGQEEPGAQLMIDLPTR